MQGAEEREPQFREQGILPLDTIFVQFFRETLSKIIHIYSINNINN